MRDQDILDALADAAARKLADIRREVQLEREAWESTRRAFLAELRADDLAERAKFRKEIDDALLSMAAAMEDVRKGVAEVLSKIKDGAPGRDGRDGVDGKDGEPGRDGEPGQQGPPGPEGEPGRDGRDGLHGRDGKDGVDGKDGAPGAAGKDGAPGRDGLGYEDLNVIHDGERGFAFVFARGDERQEFAFRVPVVLDRGVYRPDMIYAKGDGVTHGGCFWIAQLDEPKSKPAGGGGDWRLAVKCGRDGKDGKDGAPGPQGAPGERGRDLTQIGPDGGKW